MDTTAGCDVELVDDSMYVYSPPGRYLRTKTTALQKLVTAGSTLLLGVAVIYVVIQYLPTLLNR